MLKCICNGPARELSTLWVQISSCLITPSNEVERNLLKKRRRLIEVFIVATNVISVALFFVHLVTFTGINVLTGYL